MRTLDLVAYLLLAAGGVLNLAMIGLSPESDDDLPWRAKWLAQTRRYPLLRVAAVACLLVASALFLADIVVNYT